MHHWATGLNKIKTRQTPKCPLVANAFLGGLVGWRGWGLEGWGRLGEVGGAFGRFYALSARPCRRNKVNSRCKSFRTVWRCLYLAASSAGPGNQRGMSPSGFCMLSFSLVSLKRKTKGEGHARLQKPQVMFPPSCISRLGEWRWLPFVLDRRRDCKSSSSVFCRAF